LLKILTVLKALQGVSRHKTIRISLNLKLYNNLLKLMIFNTLKMTECRTNCYGGKDKGITTQVILEKETNLLAYFLG
jgi:hypothetical protein